jgi:hypothetical protein
MDGWMDGWVCVFGYGKFITRSTFVSNHKGESMQSLAPHFVHDPALFFLAKFSELAKCFFKSLKIFNFFWFSSHPTSTVSYLYVCIIATFSLLGSSM